MFGQVELLGHEVDLTKSLLDQRRALQQIAHKRSPIKLVRSLCLHPVWSLARAISRRV